MPTWVDGRVSKILYVSEQTGYAVLKLETAEGEVPVVGTLGGVLKDAGDETWLSLEGDWETHPLHGRQFRAAVALPDEPRTLDGLSLFLATCGAEGIGKVLAKRIVEHFGAHTPRILSEEPTRLTEVKGVSVRKARVLGQRWGEEAHRRALAVELRGFGLPERLIDRIRRKFGEGAGRIIRQEPYRLAEEITGIGFRTADDIARKLGLPPDSPGRVRAAALHVLDAQSSEGHTWLPRRILAQEVAALGVPVVALDEAMGALEGEGKLTTEPQVRAEDDRCWLPELYLAEVTVARGLAERIVEPDLFDHQSLVDRGMAAVGLVLDPDQQRAVNLALSGGVVVITGGPGTGKTTLVKVLLKAVELRGERWALASPTGRAARRLSEATGQPAATLHRLLEFKPGEGGFQRSMSNPLEADGLVVDETSMVDLPLAAALVRALPAPGVRFSLVFVGDSDQLPSVGPGQILRDLIDSGRVPVVRLTQVHRQAEQSGIVRAARAVHHGETPGGGDQSDDEFFVVARPDPEVARQALVQIVAERLPKKGFHPDEVQVLSPMRKGPLGTQSLNELLQQRLNPSGRSFVRGEGEFRVGDRVICTKNRYDLEVYNGDIGRIAGFDEATVQILIDDRTVVWPREDLGQVELAYAITVHKSQGSEYPAVVLALHGAHHVMLRRNLVYTAITRARRFFCLVGSREAFAQAVSRVGGDGRFTSLAWRIGVEMEGGPGFGLFSPPEEDPSGNT